MNAKGCWGGGGWRPLHDAQQHSHGGYGPGARTNDGLLTKAKVAGLVLFLSEHLIKVGGRADKWAGGCMSGQVGG